MAWLIQLIKVLLQFNYLYLLLLDHVPTLLMVFYFFLLNTWQQYFRFYQLIKDHDTIILEFQHNFQLNTLLQSFHSYLIMLDHETSNEDELFIHKKPKSWILFNLIYFIYFLYESMELVVFFHVTLLTLQLYFHLY